MQDPEIKAMSDVNEAIKELQDDAKTRVIQWILNKYSLNLGAVVNKGARPNAENSRDIDIKSFDSVANIFEKATPQNAPDKVLIVAAFLQEKFDKSELTGGEIHKELRHLGHGLSNITDTISQLEAKKPKLMIQTKKEGKSKQAKKKYKVTAEGLKAARQMLITSEA
ncbi:MAG: hypothetical protein HY956_11370 [Deltaproteobacteria bacterium]|nr:hypothetical protein [Deltaproteobacteria bacterium]